MMTPAQRHFEKHRAAKVARQGAPVERSDVGSIIGAAFQEDYRRLKSIQSIENKVAVKRDVLPRYQAYIDGIIEADQGQQDDILTTLMLWRLDAAQYDGAIEIARYALKHDLKMPPQFDRSVAAALVEEFADASSSPGCESPSLEQLQAVAALVGDADMHDQIKAKMAKELGRLLADGQQFEAAHGQLERAVQLHPGSGAKSLLKQVNAAVARQHEAGTASQNAAVSDTSSG